MAPKSKSMPSQSLLFGADDTLEYEIVFNRNSEWVNRISFRKAMARIMRLIEMSGVDCRLQQSNTLDIKTEDKVRLTIEDNETLSKIKEYCASNSLPDTNVISIQKEELRSEREIYPSSITHSEAKESKEKEKEKLYTIKVSRETVLTDKPYLLDDDREKTFRIKRRYSMVPKNNIVRYDFTIVKEGKGKRLSDCVLSEWYEIEVEALHNDKTKTMSKDAVKEIMKQAASEIEKGLTNWPVIPSSPTLSPSSSSVSSHWTQFTKKHKLSVFPARKPVTLSLKDLPNLFAASADYRVTEKVDGERFLMFPMNEFIFLVDSKGAIWPTDIKINENKEKSKKDKKEKEKQWLVDCEVVRKLNRLYILCFDAYFDLEGLPLYEENLLTRLEKTEEIVHYITTSTSSSSSVPVEITTKPFYTMDQVDEVLKQRNPDVENDGLILTPVKIQVPNKGTWNSEFKWKPIELSTIDVRVQYSRNEVTDLYVAADDREKTRKYATIPGLVKKAANDDEIRDGEIVEMSWNPEKKQWRPLRVRYDKTNPNYIDVVNTVWESIQHPVTMEMLSERIVPEIPKEKEIENNDDAYYNNTQPRSKNTMIKMQNFHNDVKNRLISLASSLIKKSKDKKNKRLLDMACGKGGDLLKWVSAGFNQVVGVDYSVSNLMNSTDGIYARLDKLIKNKKLDPKKFDYSFFLMDSSKPYADQVKEIADVKLREKAAVLLSSGSSFDTVSCQFAIHYFFESKDTVKRFFQNVQSTLLLNGTFIVTCMDGDRVNKLLSTSKNKSEKKVSGQVDDKTIWSITKKYEKYNAKSYGLKIEVYLESIDKAHEEYLVPPALLEKVAGDMGFELLTTGATGTEGAGDELNATGTFDELAESSEAAKSMSHELSQYSFLNRWYIFKKIKDVK